MMWRIGNSSASKGLANGLRGRLPGSLFKITSRSVHNVPVLANQQHYEKQGIQGLFSPEGFKVVWTDYQRYLVEELNKLTVETENETRAPFHIMLNTARDTQAADVFNLASQAYNNHFFFESLKASKEGSSVETTQISSANSPSPQLLSAINRSFDSLENLRNDMLYKADTLLGNGWVFLLEDTDKSLYTASSFNAGSPHVPGRAQMHDLNGPMNEETTQAIEEITEAVEQKRKHLVLPLLAVNVWQHAYLTDYSPSGRADYLENWWNSIDWSVVSKRMFTA